MNKETFEKHKSMVIRLGKPGGQILDSLTPDDCYLTHMGGCLCGEASELYEAIVKELDECEELGDMEFYLTANRYFWRIERTHQIATDIYGTEHAGTELMFLAGKYWDVVKRIVVYRKPITHVEKSYDGMTICAMAVKLLEQMEGILNYIYKERDYDVESILEGNYLKLADKEKGRYASGSYSDEQAVARRDKN